MTDPTETQPPSPPPPPSDEGGSPLIELYQRVEDIVHARALRLLSLEAHERETQVHLMLANRQRGRVEYWTFLMLSMAIATLGLAMDSTTVVIGAMLVSPLMGPIVEFAMGLVVGSPVLTLRSTIRIVGSVAAVVAGAWLITVVLPFQEITSEVAARTQPTLLDMALAVCVALAAALTTVKAQSETNIVAAGAAIGIALVPPICVIGFGLGIGDPEVWRGASLLLVTNFFAIIAVGVVSFYILGYERVSVRAWDDEAVAGAPPNSFSRRVLETVEMVFGSRRSGFVFRFVLPLALIAVVWLPLAEGLQQITWEAQARNSVSQIMSEMDEDFESFDPEWSVSANRVVVSAIVFGTGSTADSLHRRLTLRILEDVGVTPEVEVSATLSPDALDRVMDARLRDPAREDDRPDVEMGRIRTEFAAALDRAWPTAAYGPLIGWHVQLSDAGRVELHLQHLGRRPDAGAALLLASVLGPRVPTGVAIRFDPVDTAAVRATVEAAGEWFPGLARGVVTAQEADVVRVCVVLPDEATLDGVAEARSVAEATRALLGELPEEQYAITRAGEAFEMWLEPRDRTAVRAGAPGSSTPPTSQPGSPSDSAAGATAEGTAVPVGPAASSAETTQAPPSGGACAR